MRENSGYFFIRYAKGSVFTFVETADIDFALDKNNSANFVLRTGPMQSVAVEFSNLQLSIQPMKWCLTPVFYFQNEDHVYISSRLELIYLANRQFPFQINKHIRQNLNIKGYLDLDQTFFSDIIKLMPDHSLMLNQKGIISVKDNQKLPIHWGSLKLSDEWIHHAVSLLRTATVDLIEKGCTYIAISGGCDSRLILNLIPESYRNSLITYNKANPQIGSLNDNDHLLARKASHELGYKFMPIENPQNYFSFLDPEIPTPPVLCGLYGGEFLGGTLKWVLPEERQKSFEDFGNFEYKQLFLASLFSSRTVFYRKTEASWASPYTNFYHAKSPFLDSHFLDHLIQVNFKEIDEYRVYDKIWRLPEFSKSAKIGFESGINFFYGFPRTVFGRNPKMFTEKKKNSLDIEIDNNLSYIEKSIREASAQNICF